MDEKTVRQELVHNLEEWSLTGDRGKSHREHRRHILKKGVVQFDEENASATFEHLRNEIFPEEYSDAIRFFFRRELRGSSDRLHYRTRDELAGAHEYKVKPYYRRYDRRDRSRVVGYGVKDKFKKITFWDLDPLERFSFTFDGLLESEVRFENWFLGEEAAAEGMVFEAILACHAIYKEACFHCKSRKSLRWNGGEDTSWMDLVCISCNSTYEVKTKASMEKCESELERNQIRGGSYANYWKHRNAIRDENQKMFLVVLPRQWTANRSGKLVRPVSCWEIDHVMPVVNASCFRPISPPSGATVRQQERYKILPLKSMIKLKRAVAEGVHWFSLEKWETSIEYGSIMEEVFIEYYSREEFDRIESKILGSSDSASEEAQNQVQMVPENVVGKLKADLENMKVGNDDNEDWEDIF